MAGRPSKTRQLDIWMNGLLVGHWSHSAGGAHHFSYPASWLDSPQSRPISLSLPLAIGTRGESGAKVVSYFDNLLPDSIHIRNHIAARYGAVSTGTFDLLEKAGRDCAGAVQLMPARVAPQNIFNMEGKPLTNKDLETRLNLNAAGADFGAPGDDDLRISIAGAQEKTALLFYEGRWRVPRGATPTTHSFKLPTGEVGEVRADFSTSVENEWLCSKIMQAYGLPAADCELKVFRQHKVLVVRRFDRKMMDSGWIARLPQEDFCQVFGVRAIQKYEDKGGPAMDDILDKLRGSVAPERDRRRFLMTQLLFWMLAAPDGHAEKLQYCSACRRSV